MRGRGMTVHIIRWVDDDELSSSFAQACRAADAAIGNRPTLESIPIVGQHGMPSAAALQREYERAIADRRARYGPAIARLRTAEHLARCGDRERLKQWLIARPPQERAAILAYLRGKVSKD
jgi:hypothetical protein